MLANLPPGLAFVNDGTAHMALVSNGGVTSSLAPAGSNLFANGDDSNVDSISPTHLVTPSILTGGRQIVFSAGQVNDFDNDANNEYVVIEFNAIVNNSDGGAAASATVVVPDSVATAAINGFIKCLDTPGEPGINGVTLRLLDANGVSIATTVTHTQNGLDGYYEFTNLEAGTYTVVEDDQNLPAGVTNGHSVMVGTINGQTVGMQGADSQGNDEITNITIADGQTGVMYCFLDNCMVQPGPAKITGFVKCVDKPGEDGINGVTIRLYDSAGNLLATTLTHNQNGLDGYYEFTNLAPGTYRIVEDDQNLPPGITDANVIVVGTVNGVVDGMSGMDAQGNDYITNIRLNAGDMGMMYCFLDYLHASGADSATEWPCILR